LSLNPLGLEKEHMKHGARDSHLIIDNIEQFWKKLKDMKNGKMTERKIMQENTNKQLKSTTTKKT